MKHMMRLLAAVGLGMAGNAAVACTILGDSNEWFAIAGPVLKPFDVDSTKLLSLLAPVSAPLIVNNGRITHADASAFGKATAAAAKARRASRDGPNDASGYAAATGAKATSRNDLLTRFDYGKHALQARGSKGHVQPPRYAAIDDVPALYQPNGNPVLELPVSASPARTVLIARVDDEAISVSEPWMLTLLGFAVLAIGFTAVKRVV